MRDRGGAVEDLASAVIISQNNLSLVPLCVRSNLSQVQSDRISRHFTGRPFVMLRHAGIAAGDALARNAARATGARSVSMLCVPDPRSRTTRGRGPPSRLEFFRPFAHPRRARKAPNLTRPPRISLAPTADQTSRLHPHDCRTQILDGSVWCARVSPATRPDPRAPEP